MDFCYFKEMPNLSKRQKTSRRTAAVQQRDCNGTFSRVHIDGSDDESEEEDDWQELSDDEDFVDNIDDFLSYDTKVAETRWRQTGCNTNKRGCGSSRSTHYENEKKLRQLDAHAEKVKDIRKFFIM
jgi:hypothetical protein